MKHLLILAFATAALAACGGKSQPSTMPAEGSAASTEPGGPATPGEPTAAAKTATATLAPSSGSKVTGTITFKEVEGGVEVTANLENLTPGEHAWHVHETGDCSAPDATSAGGHFNPEGHPHGAPDAAEHHAGDFGNLTAGDDGKATKTFVMSGITLGDDASSVVGKGFIVHAKADDLTSQPSGNAGARVACGVIQRDPS